MSKTKTKTAIKKKSKPSKPVAAKRKASKPAARSTRVPLISLFELLGQRWTLRILWELRGQPLTFRALQESSGGLSPTVLNKRLAELRDADLIDRQPEGYTPTSLGAELGEKLKDLSQWAERWDKKRR